MKRILSAFIAVMLVTGLSGCKFADDVLGYDEKPVIYLYPEKETDVTVKISLDGELTCTYPAYDDGWKVTAQPDGTLKWMGKNIPACSGKESQIQNMIFRKDLWCLVKKPQSSFRKSWNIWG